MGSDVKILVVDDDAYLLDLLVETLRTIGYEAVGAMNAIDALDLLKTNDFRLVISDIKMPEMDGVEFAERVKERHQDLPVIFITGIFNSSILRKTDAEGFLSKPFRIGQMEELIKNVIAKGTVEDKDVGVESILVVDDDDTFRLMLIELLRLSGYSAVGATGGVEAIDLLEQRNIGTVITDFKMLGMDGGSLVKYVKKTRPDIPVIIITGYLPLADEQLEAAGAADGFLMKPFKIESITELLENLKQHRIPPPA